MRWSLSALLPTFNEEKPLVLDLLLPGKGGEIKQGQVTMHGVLERALKAPPGAAATAATAAAAAAVDPAAAPAKPVPVVAAAATAVTPIGSPVTHHLFISSIAVHGLKNVEMMMGDKNDPYVLVSFGTNKWSFKSDPQPDAGSEATWKFTKGSPQGEKVRFPVTTEELQTASFSVTALDKNSFTADKMIGKGDARLSTDLVWDGAKGGSEVKTGEVTVSLLDAHGKASGTATLTIERETVADGKPPAAEPLVKPLASAPAEAPTPAVATANEDWSLYKHTLYISKVEGKGLRNVEKMMFDKNDP